jgi:hypothetical protein
LWLEEEEEQSLLLDWDENVRWICDVNRLSLDLNLDCFLMMNKPGLSLDWDEKECATSFDFTG